MACDSDIMVKWMSLTEKEKTEILIEYESRGEVTALRLEELHPRNRCHIFLAKPVGVK